MNVMLWSALALLTGFVLDAIFGDPQGFPHIVRLMGRMIARLERVLRRAMPASPRGERAAGTVLVCLVAAVCAGLPFGLLFLCYRFLPPLGYAVESLLCYQTLAARSLKKESELVMRRLRENDTEGARRQIAMLVGRDTETLDGEGIARAAVETVAENTSDGVAAPLWYAMLGGAALACAYKAVNTMDSMLGYKNERYLHFGRAAARTDDALNYLPSRLCALVMAAAAFPLGLDGKGAFRVWRRDRRKHASPNSAQTEAACAGALGVRLAGPACYFGKPQDKPYIGDGTRPVCPGDIHSANRLMYAASAGMLAIALIFRALCLIPFLNV